jgi:hypothetical protein
MLFAGASPKQEKAVEEKLQPPEKAKTDGG